MAGRKRVLIVEDNEEYNNDLRKILEDYELEVLSAFSGKEALDIIKASSDGEINLILSDVKMPEGDGIFLLKELAKLKKKTPTFVLLTGYSDFVPDDIIKLGATALFTKPLDVNKLLKLI